MKLTDLLEKALLTTIHHLASKLVYLLSCGTDKVDKPRSSKRGKARYVISLYIYILIC